MKLLRDPLGRPIPRLYFDIDELDEECERIVRNFMDRYSAGFSLPVPTDDMIRMVEMEADDLDMYADLPEELDGYTDFFFEGKPRVRIAKQFHLACQFSAPAPSQCAVVGLDPDRRGPGVAGGLAPK